MKHLMLLLMAALLASCGSPAVFERPVMDAGGNGPDFSRRGRVVAHFQ